MGAKVVHFEIIGSDVASLHKFYGDIFDWDIQVMPEMGYGLVQPQGEGSIGGGIGQSQQGQPNHVTFYIEVDDPQAYLNRIEKKGGKTIVPVTEIPNMVTFALFADPQGNVVGLVKNAG